MITGAAEIDEEDMRVINAWWRKIKYQLNR
jgi:hypothetical protein